MKNYLEHFLSNKKSAALISGSFLSLAFAPLNFFIAPLVALPIFYLLLENELENKGLRKVFLLGFLFGFAHFLVGIHWIAISLLVDANQFAWLIPFALTIIPSILALYTALLAVSYKFLVAKLRLNQTWQKILLFSFCWLLFEILRSNLLSGFPWNLLGYIWMFDLHFAQIGSVFGIYGLSFFAVLIGLFPVLFWQKPMPLSNKFFGVFLISLLIGIVLFGYSHIDEKKLTRDDKTKIRMVQANIKQEVRWDESERYRNFLKHVDMTNSKSLKGVKAVIWSEASVPYALNDAPELMEYLRYAVPKNGVLITGALRLDPFVTGKRFSSVWNSIFVVSEKGATQHYDKHHLVPFGEYVPFHQFLSFLYLDEAVDQITGGGEGFSEGEGAKTLFTGAFSFSPLLCYESIFSGEVMDRDHRPDLFVNLTNDAWFGKSSGPYQHFDMARMRAIEYGISLVRVAGTGISALVDPFGRIVAKMDLGESGIYDVPLIKNEHPTIYGTYSYLPLAALLLVLLIILIVSPRKKNEPQQNNTN